MKSTVETVTSVKAQRWLDSSQRNRPIASMRVAQYSKDMTLGDWVLTGEPIIFSCKGELIDGHHRLLAVIQSGATIRTLVVRHTKTNGSPPTSVVFGKLDTGKSRNGADLLGLHGFSNCKRVAAATRFLRVYEDGSTKRVASRMTNDEVLRIASDHSGLAHSSSSISKELTKFITPAIACVSHYIIGGRDARMSDERDAFFDAVTTGEGLERGNPALTLRNLLFARRAENNRQHHVKVSALWQLGVIVKAANATFEDRSVRQLRYHPSEGLVYPIAWEPNESRG